MTDGTLVEIALAKIQLVRGGNGAAVSAGAAATKIDRVIFKGGRPSRWVVGSDESATWRFVRADVAPRQLEVVWDGAELWLQDPLRLGRTFVNGRTLNEWVPVIRQAVVCFGGVQMMMISHAKPSGQCAPDFAALDAARLTEAHQNAHLRLSDTSRITLPPELRTLLNERGAP